MAVNQPINPRVRLAISQGPQDAPRGAVSTFCAEHGISRTSFYELRKRARTEGPVAVLDPVPLDGVAGADLPRGRGVARLEPQKKPRSAWRRFVYPAPTACWQLDGSEYVLTGGRTCVIFQLIDDHSRYAVAARGVG